MPGMLCIYAPFDTPRLRYALEVAFSHILHVGYWLTASREAYSAFAGPRVNYGGPPLCDEELRIPAGELLRDTGIRAQPLEVVQLNGLPAFFGVRQANSPGFEFDFFSMIFYMASRYEEYLPGERDPHGRFPARAGIACKEGFLELPVVNMWLERLAARLEDRFPGFRLERPAFRFQPTFDVDQAWAYRYKPYWLQWAGMVKDVLHGDRRALRRRRAVMAGREEDPFFTFTDIEEWHRLPQAAPVFFFHLGDYGRFDKSISFRHPMLRELIIRLSGAHPTGIHPSWRAADDEARLAEEIRRFRDITGAAPLRSRQHFLRLEFPRTYRQLIAAGIREDHTMGFADAPGFRAGIAGPFPWYDLEAERSTRLVVHPFAVMDVTLKKYLGLSPDAGLRKAMELLQSVRRTGGVFTTLWHNSSFSEPGGWKAWKTMYLQLKTAAQEP